MKDYLDYQRRWRERFGEAETGELAFYDNGKKTTVAVRLLDRMANDLLWEELLALYQEWLATDEANVALRLNVIETQLLVRGRFFHPGDLEKKTRPAEKKKRKPRKKQERATGRLLASRLNSGVCASFGGGGFSCQSAEQVARRGCRSCLDRNLNRPAGQ